MKTQHCNPLARKTTKEGTLVTIQSYKRDPNPQSGGKEGGGQVLWQLEAAEQREGAAAAAPGSSSDSSSTEHRPSLQQHHVLLPFSRHQENRWGELQQQQGGLQKEPERAKIITANSSDWGG